MYEEEDIFAAPGGRRGTQNLIELAAAIVGGSDATGTRLGALAQEQRLREWAETDGHLIDEAEWAVCELVSAATAEHEVRYRKRDNRALKKTWPGMFGFIPKLEEGKWRPAPATPSQYLERFGLQNQIFCDQVSLEGVSISSGPSMIIGESSGGVSLVISQPWLNGIKVDAPHPTEAQISEYLRERGFIPMFGTLFGWKNAELGVVILDAKLDNFILTATGAVPIDLLITDTQPDEL